MLVVDDALLLAVLAETAPEDLQAALDQGELFTTGSWYWRLSRALRDMGTAGALSRGMDNLTVGQQARVIASIHRLPPQVGLLSLRELVPVMAALQVGRQLNLLTAEAVAVAVVLDASIVVTTDSPLLSDTCARLGIEMGVVAP
jgi:hypothetical protein